MQMTPSLGSSLCDQQESFSRSSLPVAILMQEPLSDRLATRRAQKIRNFIKLGSRTHREISWSNIQKENLGETASQAMRLHWQKTCEESVQPILVGGAAPCKCNDHKHNFSEVQKSFVDGRSVCSTDVHTKHFPPDLMTGTTLIRVQHIASLCSI